MSTSPSLYRRHRPRSFADVVGQEHVVRTLSNAVVRDMVHHAYLFVGSRGTGKTSMAKILAACLNCRDAPTITPCGRCDSCVSIASATSLDVIEMDAASSNSVDDIRALRESVAYAPVSGGRKVYILDEAHMLSTAAWNAFLKTLEEPPPNTIFVLATTEAQKVLPDGRRPLPPLRLPPADRRPDRDRPAADRRRRGDRRSPGRDRPARPPRVRQLPRRPRHARAAAHLQRPDDPPRGRPRRARRRRRRAPLRHARGRPRRRPPRAPSRPPPRRVDSGRDPAGFVRELEAHVREVLVVQTLDLVVPPEIAVTPERDDQIADQAARIPAATLVRLLDLLAAALAALRNGADGRTQLELALVKAARPALDPSTDALLERIARLEEALGGSSAPPPPAEPPLAGDEQLAQAPQAAPQQTTASSPAPASQEPLTLERIVALWPAVLEAVGTTNRMLAAVIAGALPVELADRRLVLAFPEDSAFLRRKADDSPNRVAVADAIHAVTGQTLTLAYDLRELATATDATPTLTDADWVARLKVEFDAHELDA